MHTIRQLPGGKQFQGTNDWTKDVLECRSHQLATALEIRLMVVGKGKVWFDDFVLEAIAVQKRKTRLKLKKKVPMIESKSV